MLEAEYLKAQPSSISNLRKSSKISPHHTHSAERVFRTCDLKSIPSVEYGKSKSTAFYSFPKYKCGRIENPPIDLQHERRGVLISRSSGKPRMRTQTDSQDAAIRSVGSERVHPGLGQPAFLSSRQDTDTPKSLPSSTAEKSEYNANYPNVLPLTKENLMRHTRMHEYMFRYQILCKQLNDINKERKMEGRIEKMGSCCGIPELPTAKRPHLSAELHVGNNEPIRIGHPIQANAIQHQTENTPFHPRHHETEAIVGKTNPCQPELGRNWHSCCACSNSCPVHGTPHAHSYITCNLHNSITSANPIMCLSPSGKRKFCSLSGCCPHACLSENLLNYLHGIPSTTCVCQLPIGYSLMNSARCPRYNTHMSSSGPSYAYTPSGDFLPSHSEHGGCQLCQHGQMLNSSQINSHAIANLTVFDQNGCLIQSADCGGLQGIHPHQCNGNSNTTGTVPLSGMSGSGDLSYTHCCARPCFNGYIPGMAWKRSDMNPSQSSPFGISNHLFAPKQDTYRFDVSNWCTSQKISRSHPNLPAPMQKLNRQFTNRPDFTLNGQTVPGKTDVTILPPAFIGVARQILPQQANLLSQQSQLDKHVLHNLTNLGAPVCGPTQAVYAKQLALNTISLDANGTAKELVSAETHCPVNVPMHSALLESHVIPGLWCTPEMGHRNNPPLEVPPTTFCTSSLIPNIRTEKSGRLSTPRVIDFGPHGLVQEVQQSHEETADPVVLRNSHHTCSSSVAATTSSASRCQPTDSIEVETSEDHPPRQAVPMTTGPMFNRLDDESYSDPLGSGQRDSEESCTFQIDNVQSGAR